MHRYTKEQIEFICEIAEGKCVEEILQLFIKKFNTNVTFKSIKGIMYRQGIKNKMQGYSTRFDKGSMPWNKNLKGIQTGGKDTQFKKGQMPPTHKPVGSESYHEGYIWIKIAEPNQWVKKHHYIWERVNGPIPKNHVIRFADRNKLNVTIENLFLVQRRVCTSVAKRGLEKDDPELNIATHNLAELELVIKDARKRIKNI